MGEFSYRGYLMYKENGFIKELVNDTIELLRENGIHSRVFSSTQEAKNFILYHVGVETIVLIKREKIINLLKLDKSIIELGAAIVEEDMKILAKDKKLKNSISKVVVYGNEYFLNNDKLINLCCTSNDDEDIRVKTILVISLQEEDRFQVLSKVKKELCTKESCCKNCSCNKGNYKDISVIFIEENQ